MASGLSFTDAFMNASSCFSFFGKLEGVIDSDPSSSSRTSIELPFFSSFRMAQSLGSESINVDPPVTCSLRCSSFIFSISLVTLDLTPLNVSTEYSLY